MWEQLLTSRGYVHAVDAEVLTLFRGWDGQPEWIAVERIRTLVLMGSPSRELEAGDGMGPADPVSSKRKASSPGLRDGDSKETDVEKGGTPAVLKIARVVMICAEWSGCGRVIRRGGGIYGRNGGWRDLG